MTTFALGLLGLCAGVLTTLAGQGGGLFLLVLCSMLLGPRAALAITAPALVLGNLHRAILFRHFIERHVAARMALGAVPGSLVGGFLAGRLPEWVLHVLLVGITALTVARALRWLAFDVPRAALGPAGFVIGGMTGTSGGAGVLFAPVLLSAGLSGKAFVGTIATVAVATHVGRVIAYGYGGMFTRDLLIPIVVVALAITAGNAVGERMRAKLSSATSARLEYGVLVVCVGASVLGLG